MNDRDRLRNEYARRAADPRYREWYAQANPAHRFIERDRDAVLRALLRVHPPQWTDGRILDIGCGSGYELAKWRAQFDEARLCGIDLLPERVARGREQYPTLPLLSGDASQLPLASGAFDLVMQFTVFTSILDDALRRVLASEMLRVLKPRGAIVWYDYIWNPTNPQTRGIGLREIRALFPQCELRAVRVTLAPPLARLFAPRALWFCKVLNEFPFLRSHYVALVTRR